MPGIRIASGSLGQGLSVGIGAAQAKKVNKDNRWVFTLHGDGELQEGQIWEAIMYAGAKGVDNLIATIDVNGQQIDGSTEEILSLGNLKAKFEAFGWIVIEESKGNDLEAVINVLNHAKTLTGNKRPVVILLETVMGAGVDIMAGTNSWHGKAPNKEQYEQIMTQLGTTALGDY